MLAERSLTLSVVVDRGEKFVVHHRLGKWKADAFEVPGQPSPAERLKLREMAAALRDLAAEFERQSVARLDDLLSGLARKPAGG